MYVPPIVPRVADEAVLYHADDGHHSQLAFGKLLVQLGTAHLAHGQSAAVGHSQRAVIVVVTRGRDEVVLEATLLYQVQERGVLDSSCTWHRNRREAIEDVREGKTNQWRAVVATRINVSWSVVHTYHPVSVNNTSHLKYSSVV